VPDRAWRRLAVAAVGAVWLHSPAVFGYGPAGHRIAGEAAAQRLCAAAVRAIDRLGGGQDLGEIGLWADRIRSDPEYARAAPWHYVNVADAASLRTLEHAPEGDVLEAIMRFSAQLADRQLDDRVRGEALRFLVHFVVDLHQPLHVGLAEDRGGNDVELSYRGERTNLHRFWDTHAIEQSGLAVPEYVRVVAALIPQLARRDALDPLEWAAESLSLRESVYTVAVGGEQSARYLDYADSVTRERLALAAARLAGTLNAILCD